MESRRWSKSRGTKRMMYWLIAPSHLWVQSQWPPKEFSPNDQGCPQKNSVTCTVSDCAPQMCLLFGLDSIWFCLQQPCSSRALGRTGRPIYCCQLLVQVTFSPQKIASILLLCLSVFVFQKLIFLSYSSQFLPSLKLFEIAAVSHKIKVWWVILHFLKAAALF